QFIFERCMNTTHEIVLALQKTLKFHRHVLYKINFHRVQVWKLKTLRIALPIIFRTMENKRHVFIPKSKLERTSSYWMFPKVLSIIFHHFMRNHTAILHGKHSEKRLERFI